MEAARTRTGVDEKGDGARKVFYDVLHGDVILFRSHGDRSVLCQRR